MRFKAYRATNRINGKVYIGITTTPIDVRWEEHIRVAMKGSRSGRFPFAIRKHGPGAFDVEHIASAVSWADLCETEKRLIEQCDSFNPAIGYNATKGGEGIVGVVWSDETKRLRVASYKRTLAAQGGCALKGRKQTQSHAASRAVSRQKTEEANPAIKNRRLNAAAKNRGLVRRSQNSRGLTDEQVVFARSQRLEGVLFRDLAAFYSVTRAAIERAVYGKTYRHVPMPAWGA